MARTYEPIASTTVSGTATTDVTFSSIPGTYTDLRLVVTGNTTTNTSGQVLLQLNSDTATNYSITSLLGDGSSATSSRGSNASSINTRFIDGGIGTLTVDVMSYANANVFKTALIQTASPGTRVARVVGLWRSTSAITTIKVYWSGAEAFSSGSIVSLFGIKAA